MGNMLSEMGLYHANMFTESFHNILKTVYQDNKHNRQLDHLISILLKIECDKAFGRFQKCIKENLHTE